MMRVLAILGEGAERAAAARLRAARAAGETVLAARLPAAGDAALPPGAREFVAAHGALWPNEAYWLEWGSDSALAPGLPGDGADLLVIACPDGAAPAGAMAEPAMPVPADTFGRPLPPATARGRALRIGLLGGMERPGANPAPLATLGDAADRLGLAVEPVFLDPAEARSALPGDLAGVILPGGGNMRAVSAQIAATDIALDRDLPLLGLCLGMQAMATVFVRRAGWPDATLEEIAGPGPGRSFTRLRDAAGAGWHRLGETIVRPAADTLLGQIWPDGAAVRVNHRFALAPDIPGTAGAVVHRDPSGIAEAIELPGHAFLVGLQGHPELGRGAALDRLWDAFLVAAAAQASRF
jgi:hypothetical protein